MYGTVARIQLKEGMEQTLVERLTERAGRIPGFVAGHLYRLDDAAAGYLLTVVFASKGAYVANAQSTEQAAHFQALRETMAADPEWLDGEIVYAYGQNAG